MRRLTRTACPVDFGSAATKELARAKNHFEGTNEKDGFSFTAYKHPEAKAALREMSQGNCAYCEASYDATQPVDVDHFRPKAGYETATGLHQPGYWWLAGAWNNLLPSCIRCNRVENQYLFDGTLLRTGKGNRFPLDDETFRANGIGGEAHEQPLLLDPVRDNPEDFIRFIELGGRCIAVPVETDPTSLSFRRARTSIDIYGLNRADLVDQRSRYLIRARWAMATITDLSFLLDRLREDQTLERERIESRLEEAFAHLHGFMAGSDSHSGMLKMAIQPFLESLSARSRP